MALDLSNLEKALVSLKTALDVYGRKTLPDTAHEKIVMRDGVIQRFEYTYELAWKMLKRYLEAYGLEKPDSLTNKELFRIGFESGLIRSPEKWFYYLKMRNQTSHAYDEVKAAEVFSASLEFASDAEFLLQKMKEKNS